MRFSIALPDELLSQIDEEAKKEGLSRSQFINNICDSHMHQRCTTDAPGMHQRCTTDHEGIIQAKDSLIEHLREENSQLWSQVHTLTHKITPMLPPPRPGFWSRLLSGK
jgi:metal-responsive CopG/Arc/MetJ family transcriptional regulator